MTQLELKTVVQLAESAMHQRKSLSLSFLGHDF